MRTLLLTTMVLCWASLAQAELLLMRFGANYCPSCRQMVGVFNDADVQAKLTENKINMSYAKADVDGTRLFDKYQVTTIPFMMLLDHDPETNRAKLIRKTQQGQTLSKDATLRFLTPP